MNDRERVDLEHERDQLLAEVADLERRLGTGLRDYRERDRKAAAWDAVLPMLARYTADGSRPARHILTHGIAAYDRGTP